MLLIKSQKGGVIWLITHGLIMKQVALLYDIHMAKDFPSLTCLSISNSSDITNGEIITFK